MRYSMYNENILYLMKSWINLISIDKCRQKFVLDSTFIYIAYLATFQKYCNTCLSYWYKSCWYRLYIAYRDVWGISVININENICLSYTSTRLKISSLIHFYTSMSCLEKSSLDKMQFDIFICPFRKTSPEEIKIN